MNGMFVAITVMNCTLDASGSSAIIRTALSQRHQLHGRFRHDPAIRLWHAFHRM
jgi:hypothetical protein